MLRRIKFVTDHPFRYGGVPHSGWLPPGAATPLPTPVREVRLMVEIVTEGTDSGYLLCHVAHDGSLSGDTWHATLSEAEALAEAAFGIRATDWQHAAAAH